MSYEFVSGSFASSSRPPRELEAPLIFSEDYQLVTNWYNLHRSNGSTTICTMQLRKEHDSPFHEFIMVLTKAGYSYRVDRGTDGPVWNTLSEKGVPPRDTIALLQLTSWTELDQLSYSAIDLRWGEEKTIDLKFILDIGFEIHNNSGSRYRLLTHNCYFFAQTIITIGVRKTVALRNGVNGALNMALKRSMTWELFEGAAKGILHSIPRNLKWTRKLAAQVGAQVCRPIGPLLEGLLERLEERLLEGVQERLLGAMQEWMQKRLLEKQKEKQRERLLELEWELKLGQQLLGELRGLWRWWRQELVQQEQLLEALLERLLEQRLLERLLKQRERERLKRELPEQELLEWDRRLEEDLLDLEWLGWGRGRREKMEQWLEHELLEREQLEWEILERPAERLLGRGRGHGLRVKQKYRWWCWWRKREGQEQEQEQENEQKEPEWESLLAQAQTLTAEMLFGVLERFISGDVDPGLRVEGGLGLFLDNSVFKFVEFPGSFSASLKLQSNVPKVRIEQYEDFAEYTNGLVERHVESVPVISGIREHLKREIREGMESTWCLVAQSKRKST